jgi:hypothetical protein
MSGFSNDFVVKLAESIDSCEGGEDERFAMVALVVAVGFVSIDVGMDSCFEFGESNSTVVLACCDAAFDVCTRTLRSCAIWFW